jgi:hypothetical protein
MPGGTEAPVVVGSAAIQIVADSSQLPAQIQSQVGGAFKGAMDAAVVAFNKSMDDMAGKVADTADKSKKSFTSFGDAGARSWNQISQATRLAGAEFGPVERSVGLVSNVVNDLKGRFDALPSSVAKVGAATTALGAGITAVGALAVGLGKKQEQAHIDLETAIKNTGHSYEEYGGQIADLITKEERHNHSTADTQTALSKLTFAFKDPQKAAEEMGTVDEWAAARHISLASAAQQVIMAHNGVGRSFKQYSITVANVTKLTTASETATTAHGKAVEILQRLQEKQGQQAQLAGAKSGSAAASAASQVKAHRDAVANLAKAEEEFQKLAAGPAADKVEAGYIAMAKAARTYQDDQDNLNDAWKAFATLAAGPTADQVEGTYLAIQKAARTTRDDQQKVIDLQDALDKLVAGPGAEDQAKAEEAVGKAKITTQKATYTQADAEGKLAALRATGTATARQLDEAEMAVQEARYGVDDASRAQAASEAALQKLRDDSLAGSKAMKTAEDQLADAKLQLREAQLAENDASKKQADMYAASLPGSAAYETAQKKVLDATIAVREGALGTADAAKKQADLFAASLPGSDAYTAAQKKVADAQDAVAAANDRASSSGAAGLATQFAEENLAGQIADAQKKVEETAKAEADAKATLTDATGKNSLEQQINTKFHGLAERQAHTFTGQLDALKTRVLDAAGAFGVKFGPELVKAGPLIMGVGTIIETGLIPKLIAFGGELIGTGLLAAKTFGSMAIDATAGAISWAASMLGIEISTETASATVIASTGGIALIIGAIVLAVYELWTHWDKVWTWVKDAAKAAAEWIHHHLMLIVVAGGPIGLLIAAIDFLAHHWSDIWDGIQTVVSVAWGVIKSILNGGIDLINGFVKGAGAMLNGVLSIASHIPGVSSLLPSHVDLPVIPRLAAGGSAIEAGLTWVGERGPELMQMPRGATVLPLPAAGRSTGTTTGTTVTVAEGAVQITVEGNATAETAQLLMDAGDHVAERLAAAIRQRGGV